MKRFLFLILFASSLNFLRADDGPPVAITAPEKASTFIHAKIKNRSLIWDDKKQVLEASITFVDDDPTDSTEMGNDDSHTFTFPGTTFDPKQGVFYAPAKNGNPIPIAKFKKILFIAEIKLLPNAQVQIEYPHGEISVNLVALQPDDPALHPAADTNTEQSVNVNKLF